jgi:hypothetical protein
MDEFDFVEKKPKRRFRLGAALLNLISLGILVATIALGAYYVLIFLDPQSEFNPFPPPPASSNTATVEVPATEVALEVSEEPTATDLPKATATATEIPATATTAATRQLQQRVRLVAITRFSRAARWLWTPQSFIPIRDAASWV